MISSITKAFLKIIIHGSIEWDVSGLNGDTISEDQSQKHGTNGDGSLNQNELFVMVMIQLLQNI